MRFFPVFFVLTLLLWPGQELQARAQSNPADSIVKIQTVKNPPSYHQPWQSLGRRSTNGTGFVVSKGQILTNAHVVSDAVFINVRKAGKTKKYPARVALVDHESDLALLTVDSADFFTGIPLLSVGELPDIQEKVAVYGFPDGGDMMSITEGVVSRVEHVSYAYSSAYLLGCQIDASINSGNSGGPVILDGKVVGVAFQGMDFNYENIGYMVPSPMIRQFLRDAEDKVINGIPDLGVTMQKLESPYLRSYYAMGAEENGALINRVLPGSPAEGLLFSEDVILQVDGQELAYDGTIEFRPGQRTYFGYILQQKQLGDSVVMQLKRAGKNIQVTIPLAKPMGFARLVPIEHQVKGRYYILGGLVFQPLTFNYLYEFGGQGNWFQAAPVDLVNYFFSRELEFVGQEVVVLSEVLADEVNVGYHELRENVIHTVNGQKVRNFLQFIEMVENATEDYLVISMNLGIKMILERGKITDGTAKVLRKYDIQEDRRLRTENNAASANH